MPVSVRAVDRDQVTDAHAGYSGTDFGYPADRLVARGDRVIAARPVEVDTPLRIPGTVQRGDLSAVADPGHHGAGVDVVLTERREPLFDQLDGAGCGDQQPPAGRPGRDHRTGGVGCGLSHRNST